MNDKRPFIRHITIELWSDLNNVFNPEDFFDQLIKALKLKVVDSNKHLFENNGLTKVCILSTSHIALHTWPELGYIHIDLLSCREDLSEAEVESVILSLLSNEKEIPKYVVRKIEEL